MKNVYLVLTTFILALSIISCQEDTTTFATEDLPDVAIDTSGMGELSILQFNELEVTPTINTSGVSDSELSYEWRLYIDPSDTLSEVISEEKNLNGYQIELVPNLGDQHYRLQYTVTDETTGLDYVMAWPLYVLNSLGEGLIVAETPDDTDTDLSLIMAPEITDGYEEVSIKRNVYSAVNGELISGLIKDLQASQVFRDEVIFGITDNSIVRVEKLDYTFGGINDDLFFYAPSEGYSPQGLGIVNQNGTYTVYQSNNNLTGASTIDRQFVAPLDSDFIVPDEIAVNEQPSASTVVSFYDEVNEQFIYLPMFFSAFNSNVLTAVPSASGEDFDPADVPGKENIVADVGANGNYRHLLKDKTNGDYHLYVLSGDDSPIPLDLYDFSSAPEIDNAEYFVLPDNQRVMYYATKTKIYAALYSTSTPIFEERYTVPSGEEITTLQLYHEADYPTGGPYLDTDGRQLVMSTYDGSEGRVHLLPITNLGVGNIDEGNITTFEGFGRITAIAPQE